MNTPDPTPYDQILYPGHPYHQTHPDRLSSLATLLGMHPAPVDRCRVLELGCSTGANLIPMAWGLPASEFAGIDLATRPVAEGQATIRKLGLGNIQLHQMDIMNFPEEMGTFDYIIAHGLYSWVPPAVRDKLMALCQRHLTDNGVAFVSYNTYPGCHIRNMVRDMMLYHVHNAPDPQTKIRQAQSLLKFLVDSQTEPDEYGTLLSKEMERVLHYPVGLLYHDDLAEINHPVYFHQFIEHAGAYDLQFLSEAEYFMMQTDQLPEHTVKALDELRGNIIAQQQYLDFLRCRRFRQTLICRQGISLNYEIQPEQLAGFYYSSPCTTDSAELEISSSHEVEFQGKKGSRLRTNNPLAKAALHYLGSMWPMVIHFDEILTSSLTILCRGKESDDALALGAIMQNCLVAGLVNIHICPPRLVHEPGEYPETSPVARLQALQGDLITTPRHHSVRLADTMTHRLVQMLDGTRNLATLTSQLRQTVQEMVNGDNPEGQGVTISAGETGELEVKNMLHSLARLGLLVQ
jgi:SAM-dependent methyltransferase/methyltransferase-like protein